MLRFILFLAVLVAATAGAAGLCAGSAPAAIIENPTGPLTLRQALRLVLLQNPELAAYDTAIRAAEARQLQAGLRPNPTLFLEADNLTGSGAYRDTRQSETTLQLSQLVELGGKRAARVRVAAHGRELAGFDYDSKRLEVLTETAQTFVQTLAAQERIGLAEENARLAEGLASATQQRVQSGRASSAETARATAAAATLRIELQQARRDLAIARQKLAASWGANAPRFGLARGELGRVAPAAAVAALSARLQSNPALARFSAELAQRRAALALAQADATPDVTLALGPRYLAGSNDATIRLNVSLPLPLTNRNQGTIREAFAELVRAGQLQQAAAHRLGTALTEAYQNLLTARAEIETLNGVVLPATRQAFDAINDGFQSGRFSYLEAVEARRALTAARVQLLAAQAAYQSAVAKVEGLTAGPLFSSFTQAASRRENAAAAAVK